MFNEKLIPLYICCFPDSELRKICLADIDNYFVDMMATKIQKWYEYLSDDGKKIFDFTNSHFAIATAMMFFTGYDMGGSDFNFYYNIITEEMQKCAMLIYSDDRLYKTSHYQIYADKWFAHMTEAIFMYKMEVDKIEEQHKFTLSMLSPELKEKVKNEIIMKNEKCQFAAQEYWNTLKTARKGFLYKALEKRGI